MSSTLEEQLMHRKAVLPSHRKGCRAAHLQYCIPFQAPQYKQREGSPGRSLAEGHKDDAGPGAPL